MLALIELLGMVSLRSTQIAEVLVDHNVDIYCLRIMKRELKSRKIQLHGCFLLRNLIGKCHSCENRLINAGLVEHLEQIKTIDSDVRMAVGQVRRSLQSVEFLVCTV